MNKMIRFKRWLLKINDCNSKIDKIEDEFLQEFVNIGNDLDNMNEDITKSMISSSRNTKKKSR